MENQITPILTPDQRLRVFVSSTLQELSAERMMVRASIEKIHLTPVMFELGARPHAPRDLYRQYLAQSQIFVGIYWERYGWVAPEETVSGLEDEYNLSGNLPKLIYIKHSEGQREERLVRLIERIQKDDKASYKTFRNPEELADLVLNDLAVLLTERFNLTLQHNYASMGDKVFDNVPFIPSPIIGREKNLEEIMTLLSQPQSRLVTLTGPGGTGKTRLAIETAHRIKASFRDGVAFIPLAPVKDHSFVVETICDQLGLKATGNILESLKLFLQEKSILLVLDNFEQVIAASSIIDDLLFAAPHLKLLVTSRERLALSFEQTYNVPTLPNVIQELKGDEVELTPAMQLFIERAKAIQPFFTLNTQNREIIYRICHRLEGLPLAIELAAGQVNLFTPAMLLEKLEDSLEVLQANYRDIPDRQKTMRNAIEWSYDLLSADEQTMLLRISVFNSGCRLEAIESMMDQEGISIYHTLGSLIDKSLITKKDEGNYMRFQMLEYVREFAVDKLKAAGMYEACKELQADYYHHCLNRIKLQQNKIDQKDILKCLEQEHNNLRQVMDYLLDKNDLRKLTELAWTLWLFWWVNAHTKEGYTWMKRAWMAYNAGHIKFDDHTFSLLVTNVGAMSFLQRDMETFQATLVKHLQLVRQQEDDELVATASLIAGVVNTIIHRHEDAELMLQISLERYKRIGLTTGISLTLSALGRNALYGGLRIKEAKAYYEESMALARRDENEISVIICLSGFALCEVMDKSSDAKKYLRESIQMSQSMHFYEALAWSIEIWALVSINEGNYRHAVTLMGAVDHLRETTQLPVWDDLHAIILEANQQMQHLLEPREYQEAWDHGISMKLEHVVEYAMHGAEQVNAIQEALQSLAG
jgi:predicted ATPase